MPPKPPKPDPEALAIMALGFLASEPTRISRFLDLTGIEPSGLRQAAAEPHFLASVLDHLLNDESLLLAFASEQNQRPDAIAEARRMFGDV